MTSRTPPFPGGTGVTHLAVYDWPGPDGLPGGSAHVHLACTEGYVVLAGTGRLQTLGPDGYAETRLTPLTVAWFSPGVIHRLVNDGGLEILVVMQNGGLPEIGDAVLTFPPEHLTDPADYRRRAALADPDGGYASDEDGARRRKDLAVQGFLRLRAEHEAGRATALDEFYAAAAALVRPGLPDWREWWNGGALAAARGTGGDLLTLEDNGYEHLHQGALTVVPPPARRRYGMCGRLLTYPSR